GMHADDCYAFGMTLAMVVLGCNPFHGMDDAAILRLKLEKGSFSAAIGNRRLSPSHIELLRGLLADDPRQRWLSEDLEQWMTGRRLTPKNSDAGRRASRHFDVAGKEYWQVRPLAMALSENVPEAVKHIESGNLEKWVTRSLGDEERAKSIIEAVQEVKEAGKTSHYQDQLVARACIALDPSAPIRYRGLNVMPTGIATALVEAVATGQNLQTINEIISSQLVTLWVNVQKDAKMDLVPFAQHMERMRGMVEKDSFGSGLELALYEMNPGIPCLSPMFKNDCVLSPKHVLASLERIAASGGHPSDPIDRHLAAYLIAREKRSEALFAAMSPTETGMKRGLAMLSLFGEMQYRYGPDQLPRLCAWLLPLVEPCFKRFLSKPLQEKVRRQAKEAVEKGSLSLLLKRVDDPDRVIGDETDFLAARQMYQAIQKEMEVIQHNIKNKDTVARDLGRPVSASIASLLALILIALTLWRTVWNGLIG
ncbi:MAG TPA: serine/threonine protein kinase, partial [Rhodospirillaceae bacterium]|nr:serine/threonine protein kinase [Rhodospirillaceae bacterium]